MRPYTKMSINRSSTIHLIPKHVKQLKHIISRLDCFELFDENEVIQIAHAQIMVSVMVVYVFA